MNANGADERAKRSLFRVTIFFPLMNNKCSLFWTVGYLQIISTQNTREKYEITNIHIIEIYHGNTGTSNNTD